MRAFMDIINETIGRLPSPELVEAVVAWANGFNPSERPEIEKNLLKHLDEARYFAGAWGTTLYRGLIISDDAFEKLKDGQTVSIPFDRLTSWTKDSVTAVEYADGSNGDHGIAIKKDGMKMIVDIEEFVQYMPTEYDDTAYQDHIRYAEREREVVVETNGHLTIAPQDVYYGLDPDDDYDSFESISESISESSDKEIRDEIYFPEYPDTIKEYVIASILELQSKGYVASFGRERVGMIHPDKRHVIKIPIRDRGMTSNSIEYKNWKMFLKNKHYVPMAKCRIIIPNPTVGIPFLVMEYIEPLPYSTNENMPRWVDSVDCRQVGYNKRGELVAYDL